ncbi:MAG: LON peptidase substrate-binding domain-containing protein [Chloroflexota bacterium]
MFELPLFPLNTVLFPGMSLSLHIFEERYKLMIGRCIEANQPFGAVLIKTGSEVLSLRQTVKPFLIGSMAQITQVQSLSAGRLNITAIGQERFRILSLRRDQAYLVGQVESYPLDMDHSEAVGRSARLLRPWVERYLGVLEQTEKTQIDLRQLPQNDLALAYYAAGLLKISLPQKQNLLALSNAAELTEQVRMLYRKEVTLLKALLFQPEHEQEGPFSLN